MYAVVDYDGRTRGTCVEKFCLFVSTDFTPKKVNVSSESCIALFPSTSTAIFGG